MKRYTFTCVLEGDFPASWDEQRAVRCALTYGEKHQDFALYTKGSIQTEEIEDEEES